MKFLYWDTEAGFYNLEQGELFRRLDEENDYLDIWELWPFGMSMAGLLTSDMEEVELWYNPVPEYRIHQPMGLGQVNLLLDTLSQYQDAGYKIFGWNTTGYDFQHLARLTGRYEECTQLCKQSYDPCFQSLCQQGFPVGLNAVAKLIPGLPEKEMLGSSAPLLWMTGQWEEVLEYGKNDVVRLEGVVKSIMKRKAIQWVTKRGGVSLWGLTKFLTVEQCLEQAKSPPHWMKEPINPLASVGWWRDAI